MVKVVGSISKKIRDRFLFLGGLYFLMMSIAHYFSIKLPLLFIYWDVPFFAYQDKIIAFALVSYASLFITAAKHDVAVPAALLTISTTAIGLCLVNTSPDLTAVLSNGTLSGAHWQIVWQNQPSNDTTSYWLQTLLISAYAVLLNLLHASHRQQQNRHSP